MIAARKGTEPGLYAFVAAPQSCGAILFAKANKISLGAQRRISLPHSGNITLCEAKHITNFMRTAHFIQPKTPRKTVAFF